MITEKIRSEMIGFSHRMDQKGWVANHDGNLSLKLPQGNLAITPSGRAKFNLKEDDLLEVNLKGEKVSGKGNPFSELAVHLRVYEKRTDVAAIVHAHCPSAMAVGVADQELLTWAVPEAVVSLGPGIPLVGLTLPNSEKLWRDLDPLLPHYNAVMIAGNGVFAWGADLEQAFLRVELVEHIARSLLSSIPLGGPRLLPPEEVSVLLEKRKKAGLSLPSDPARPHWFPGQNT